MRMMENNHQSPPAAAYRIMNEHATEVVVAENVLPEKGGTDDDDDDVELVTDAEINSRLAMCRSDNGQIANSPRSRMENEKRLRREIANSNERRRMQSINAGFQSLKALLPRRDGEKMSKASILQQTADFIRTLQMEKDILLQQSEIKQPLGTGMLKLNQQLVENASTPSCIPKIDPLLLERRFSVDHVMTPDHSLAPPKKRKKFDNDSADEGVGMMSDAEAIAALRTSSRNSSSFVLSGTAAAATQTDWAAATADASCCTTPFPMQQSIDLKTMESSVMQEKLLEIEMLQRQLIELRLALDRERRVRLMLEEQMRLVELKHLQAFVRFQSMPLVDYGMPQTLASSALSHPPAISPMVAVRASSPLSMRPASDTVSITTTTAADTANFTSVPRVTAASFTDSIATTHSQPMLATSWNSLHSVVSSQVIPPPSSELPLARAAAASACDIGPLPAANVANVSNCGDAPVCSSTSPSAMTSTSKQPGHPQTTSNGTSVYQSSSSRQSLAAIVEAIRHLEGDQLFVDVELQRPVVEQQSAVVNAMVATTTGTRTVVTDHCRVTTTAGSACRPDCTDSGISSPVSERQAVGPAMLSCGPFGGHNAGLMLMQGQGGGNDQMVAATVAALHNLCFPYVSSKQVNAPSSGCHQQQGRNRVGDWTSATLH